MRSRVTSLAVVCLLSISLTAAAQQDIFSAVPADAYGFVATKSLQGSYDKIMTFAQAMGLPAPTENQLLAIQEHVGDIDLNGPAAIILLNPQKFSGEPIALLFSAADAESVLESYSTQAEGSDIELPAGVAKGDDGYLAVKNGFVVFAPKLEQVAAVLASQASLETMPAVKAAFDKGQIVLAGDLQQAGPWITQMLDIAKTQMAAQMDATPMPQSSMDPAMLNDLLSWEIGLVQAFIKQTDKLAVALDVTADHAVLTKHVLFQADSSAAALMNAQIGQTVPAYNALPGGPFLLAGGVNMATGEFQSLTENILNELMSLPSLRGKFSDEQMQQHLDAAMAANAMISGGAFTLNIGNPMTGMLNVVANYDVSDAPTYRKLYQKMSEIQNPMMQAFGLPMSFVCSSAAETCSGVEVDTIKMQITPPAEGAEPNPMLAQQMQMMAMMYGPDMTFRMSAPTDKQVLFTMGGGSELMERAILVAQGHGSALSDEAKIKQAAAILPADRFAEAHLDLSQVMPMIMMLAMAGGAGQSAGMPTGAIEAPPVSFSCSAEMNTFRSDMVLHSATIKSLVETLAPMMQQRMGPGGPPDEEF